MSQDSHAPGSAGPHPEDAAPDDRQRRELVILGAHGGAGTTTLAAWLQPARDLGALQAGLDPGCLAGLAARHMLVLACRCTAPSAARAAAALAAIRVHGRVSVLAVVSDGWPEPSEATRRLARLESKADVVVRIPFLTALRVADDPASVPLPRRAVRALAEIQAAAGRSLPF